MANTFMCSIEEKLARENKLPDFYRRYVDNTFALVPDLAAATDFFSFRMMHTQQSNLQWKQQSSAPVSTENRPTKGFYAIISAMLNQNRIELIDSPVRIILPFKDQKSADTVSRQLSRTLERKSTVYYN